jgi:hypothetical protein
VDGEEFACVGFLHAGEIPIGVAAPDAVEFVVGGIGVLQLEGFGDVHVEGLCRCGWIAEGEYAFARAPCGPFIDLQLVWIAADPVNIFEGFSVGAAPASCSD